MGYWHTFHYCNSAPRVSGPAAGRGGRGGGIHPFFSTQWFWVFVSGGVANFSLVFNFER